MRKSRQPDDGGTAGAVSQPGQETIVAVITPPGEGGIAALRLAGPKSSDILQKHFIASRPDATSIADWQPFLMHHGTVRATLDGHAVDEVMAVRMPAGQSYTGLDQIELYCHGGTHVVKLIQDLLLQSGARAAEPGEFTRLAFENGRIDLAEAEGVAEMIAASTDVSYRAAREHLLGAYSAHLESMRHDLIGGIAKCEAAVDFPEEGIEPERLAIMRQNVASILTQLKLLIRSYRTGRIAKEGFKIALGGRPNAGKSSLFNLLLRKERALVTPTAGTTRDYLSEWVDIGGVPVNLIDTAGLRKSGGAIERAGMDRARGVIEEADLLVWIVDISQKGWRARLTEDLKSLPKTRRLLVHNKTDNVKNWSNKDLHRSEEGVSLSCKTEIGLEQLHEKLTEIIQWHLPDLTSGLVVTSARHLQKLSESMLDLEEADSQLKDGASPEIVVFSLRQSVNAIDEIVGRVYTEEILGEIFSKFCIGK